ncbi:MAG TPA: tetratricopeptide repeat protein [Flavipsychrobacter sp.]|nr:tetratricopeptide repeat protein [Flavipsychrobacter sp.]
MILRKTTFFSIIVSFNFFSAFAQVGIQPISDRNKDASAMYIDAVKARMLDDVKQEESLLKEVIKQKPDEAAPYYDLARLYEKQRKYDQAEELIKKAIDRNKENSWYQAAYAEILESQNKVEQAAEVYKTLAAKEKHNKEYIFKAMRLYESAGKYKEAIVLIDQLVQIMGKEEFLFLQKQQLHLRINDLDGAAQAAQQLIDMNPQEGRYYLNLAELYNNNNQQEKATAIYEKLLKQFPEDGTIQHGLALYYKNKKDIGKYDEFMRKAILNREFDDETQTSLLLSYLQELITDSVRKKQSIGITKQLVDLHPNNAQIVNLYGEILIENNEPEKAQEQFRKALSLDPSRFAAWQRLLFSFTDRKDADSLVKYSQQAMRYFPNQALVHYLNGVGNFNKQSYSAAVKSINRAIDLQADDNKPLLADMYSLLGDVHNAAGNNAASDSSYEKALRLNPENPSVLNNYAYYLSVRGSRLADAEKMSKKSLALRPDEPTFLDTYGWILYKQGNYEKAKDYIQRALDKNPDADGTLYDHLGDIYYKLNDKDKAVELWKKAKEKGTDNTQIDKKIQDKKLYE